MIQRALHKDIQPGPVHSGRRIRLRLHLPETRCILFLRRRCVAVVAIFLWFLQFVETSLKCADFRILFLDKCMVEITKQRKCNAHVRLPREACDEHVYAAKNVSCYVQSRGK